MEDLQNYLKEKLEEFKHTYNVEYHLNSYSDRHIKQQWKADNERMYNQWLSVKDVSGVMRFVNGFIGTVEQYENIKGVSSDAYDMNLALYKSVNAIQKMTQCYDMKEFDFCTFKKDDIDGLFSILYNGLDKMENVNMRRAMQD